MKKVLEESKREVAEYYSDFSGERFLHDIPEVVLKMSFGYGSRFDDSEFEIHLTDEENKQILNLIKNNLSDKSKDFISKLLDTNEVNLESAIHSRDYNSCDYYSSNCNLFSFLLDKKDER
jgi:hypothetical protein